MKDIEIKHLENLLDISEEDYIDVLYDINDSLFELLETIVPELTMTTTDDDIEEQPADAETRIKMRKNQVKQREIKAVKIAKGAEELIRAKSSIKTARLSVKGSNSPESKSKAQKDLVKARGKLRTIGVKSATEDNNLQK